MIEVVTSDEHGVAVPQRALEHVAPGSDVDDRSAVGFDTNARVTQSLEREQVVDGRPSKLHRQQSPDRPLRPTRSPGSSSWSCRVARPMR
ncbi:hypothetical protein, partial [Natronobacterium gregoryi]|uniref:hypothetical protein n=1 Tax=Natronobacterium gregoryi TaxID=44930 RepID=UPI001F4C7474